MKILHIITSMHTGGAEKFCVDLCNTQVNISKNDIFLCVLDSITEKHTLLDLLSPSVQLISLNKEGGYSIRVIYKIYQLFKTIKPDIVHLNGRALVYSAIPIILNKIPSIYTVHTMADKEHNKFIRTYIKLLFNRFPALFKPVAISTSVSRTIQSTYGSHLTHTIYNGSSKLSLSNEYKKVVSFMKENKLNEKTIIFLYLGRFQQAKNTLLLIDVFNHLLEMNCNIKLFLVGYDPVPNQVYLKQCEDRNKFPKSIIFLGRKDNVADYLYSVDALCLTSHYEGLGIAALEAFSMGVPVLSTPSGGPEDIIIDGINGYISEKINVDSYVKIIKKFIEKPLKDRAKIVEIYNKNYTMEICANKYLACYKNCIQNSMKK
ncbi:MAG TPA: glycosyltransferase [Campylobacterales bacterium]|nr:glycosyltransferase [Campylobacterales bacterium]